MIAQNTSPRWIACGVEHACRRSRLQQLPCSVLTGVHGADEWARRGARVVHPLARRVAWSERRAARPDRTAVRPIPPVLELQLNHHPLGN